MVLDIILVAIVVITAIFGFRKGFIYTFTHALGWLGAIIAGLLLGPYVRGYLTDKTGISDSINTSLLDRFGSSGDQAAQSVDSLPAAISAGMSTAATEAANLLASHMTNIIMILLGFAIVLIAIKGLFFTLTMAISKKENRGFVGFFDGILGFVAGVLKGIILIFVFLTLLLPVVNLVSPDMTAAVLASMDSSRLARALYDSNFIVLVLHDIFN